MSGEPCYPVELILDSNGNVAGFYECIYMKREELRKIYPDSNAEELHIEAAK
jgi:hypothetical protein